MRNPGWRISMLGVATIAAIALTGCGAADKRAAAKPTAPTTVSDDQRGIIGTVDALQAASRDGDGRRICTEIFTAQLVRSIEKAAARSCATELKHTLNSPDAEISVGRDIKVTGLRATATMREQNNKVSELFMVKHHGRWRIDRVVAKNPA